MEAKQTKRPVKLEERSSAKKDQIEKPSQEEVQSMIKSKMMELQSSKLVKEDKPKQKEEQPELFIKLEQIIATVDASSENIQAELLKFYQEIVLEEFKNSQKQILQEKLKQDLLDYKFNISEEQLKSANLIIGKYEILAKEYQSQNKGLAEKHVQIIKHEKTVREGIIKSFEGHLTQIKTQMKEDAQKIGIDTDITKETQNLKQQYETISLEILEKTQLMDKILLEKESTQSTIEDDMNLKIKEQSDSLLNQVQLYQEQSLLKKNEEKELGKVLSDYKSKYEEFNKALKKSKDTFKKFEAEIKDMNKRVLNLEKQRKEASSGTKDVGKKEDRLKKVGEEWEVEKLNLIKQRDELKESCTKVQLDIKTIQEGKKGSQEEKK